MTDNEQQQLEQLAKEVVSAPSIDIIIEKEVQEDIVEKDKSEETLEDILSRHRKEERDLNNKIIALKKSVPKNNKSKRREINSQISDLEYNLKQNQQKELRVHHAKQSGIPVDTVQDEVEEDGISLDALNRLTLEEEPVAPSSSPTIKPFVKKPNKAKLKKEKREKEMQRLREEAEKEAENQVDMGKLESESILELLVPMNLKVQEITADGHCLYNAISAQLLKRYNDQCDYQELRRLTAEYMRQHPDDFIPFLYKDDGDIFGPDDFEKYCNDIESTPRWGGQLEILALSKAKKVPIHIVQMGAPVLKMNEEEFSGKKPLKLAYHKHLYSLGAHYNSLLDL